jgi:hypothetical protein
MRQASEIRRRLTDDGLGYLATTLNFAVPAF